MKFGDVALVLAVVLIVALSIGWILRADPNRRSWRVFAAMDQTPAYTAFAPNPNFADGKTLQPPAEGTIARGTLPLHYQATPQDAGRAGEELVNPFAPDDVAALERGAVVYGNFCVTCHGADGSGNGTVVQRGFPPPPSLLAERAQTIKDGEIFHIITYGQNNMPPHASLVPREDRWKVILHVRRLQAQSSVGSPPAAATGAEGVEP